MKVRDILHCLQEADQDAVVLFQTPYADPTDAEEICDVVLEPDLWVCERHRCADGGFSDVHHPATGGHSMGWHQSKDERWSERVVILTSAS